MAGISLGNDRSACHVQVEWSNQEVPFVSHYAGCTVSTPPDPPFWLNGTVIPCVLLCDVGP